MIPAAGYNTGFYSMFDNACKNANPVLSQLLPRARNVVVVPLLDDLIPGGGDIRGLCRRARALTVRAARYSRESEVAAFLDRHAGGRRPVYAWRYALR